ncbi:DUF4132 domain-containing protein [Streptomyces griseocarneus]|uniref:DUF4132 domain-containing protein n=1 Tax=Streptomyces griseocarneus TaxID=51201 RepID=UPI0019A8B12C|nr:DUF4132 domain-containing protein [Streptomyces griseocarneus]MBZ6473933.1 DUF4132 domain-containing protein [Streptomyces griseocarneus]GHG65977.1 hypothetical protein GCM10018779_37070 [Streptomyces griseocarneus]
MTTTTESQAADQAADCAADQAADQARMEELGELYVCYNTHKMWPLLSAALAAGQPLPGSFVGVLRRTALIAYWQVEKQWGKTIAGLTEPVVNPGEAWADRALAELPALDDAWRLLLAHAATACTARPTAKWDKTARALLDELDALGEGSDAVRGRLLSWLALVGRPRTAPVHIPPYGPDPNTEIDPYNADALRGITRLLALLPPHPDTVRGLGALVEFSLRKVPGVGPRSPKLANAAVIALSRVDGDAALAELARLSARVTYKGTLKQLDTALTARAEAMGLGRDEIEELAVPSYGLTEVGRSVHALGDCAAELAVLGGKAVLAWRNATGKAVKSPPAAVRRDHADELKELKAAVKDIDKMLGAQSERLDRLFLARRRWRYAAWRERYADHPLVGTLARRMLWIVDGRACGFADGAWRTLADAEVTAGPDAPVELWHPAVREPAEVLAWREWLERHGVTQPFKQAHREVYLLTDAERATRVYSNRFAAHVLRQHQFHSLTAVRGWRNKLRLCVDDSYPPALRVLSEWGLRAEFRVDGVEDRMGANLTESGSYLWLATDQVRFYPVDAPQHTAHAGSGDYRPGWNEPPAEPVPLAEIPPLVLSEVLRDVDLFVGVASVGNDPTWQDGGPEGRFRDYWTSYGFGELSQSAETRAALLARLVPRLAISDRCTVEGRFLLVRGELHTYKIHMGSGNILISPHDRYLCIVPKAAGAVETGYLPFEGDRTLSTILSKAMMLARDNEITDPTITSQL